VSVIFLLFVAIVMNSPPVFIHDVNEEKAKKASHNAFVVAGLYGLTFVIAVFMYYRRVSQENSLGKLKKSQSNSFGDDTTAAPAFTVPLVSSASDGASSSTTSESTRATTSTKKGKKSKSGRNDVVTSI
jgi:Na+/proline symporter